MQSPIQSLNRCLVASLHRCHGPKQPLPGGEPPTGSDGAPPSGSELASPSSPAGSPPGSPRAAAVDGVAPRARPLSSLLRLYDVLLALAVGLVCAHSLWDGSLGSALCVCGLALAAALSTCLLGVREGRGSSDADGSARTGRADRAKAARAARSLSASMLATPPEQVVIDEVMAALRANPEEGLESSGRVLEVQLLRFIREHGSQPAKIERLFRKAVQWKAKHLPHHMMAELKQAAQTRWISAAEMPNGEWATPLTPIGVHCGFSRADCPVKLERLGKFELNKITATRGFRPKLNAFYLALVDILQRRLDLTSVETGRLVQTYEIFDLEGLGGHMLTLVALNFTRDVLMAFATHYPSSFRKAVIINAPEVFGFAWRFVSTVLPASVTDKVNVLGHDYMGVLREDLTDEALYWVTAPCEALIHAPRRPGEAAGEAEAAPQGEGGVPAIKPGAGA